MQSTPTILADADPPLDVPLAAPETEGPRAAIAFCAGRAILVLLAYFGVQLAIGMLIGFLGVIVTAATGGSPARLPGAFVVAGFAVAFALSGLTALALARRFASADPQGPGLEPFGWMPAPQRARTLAALAGVALAALFVFVVWPAFPHPRGAGGFLARSAGAGVGAAWMWAFLAVCVAPPVEEFVFRGVLWTGLERSWGPLAAGTVVTLLFVGAHAGEVRGYLPAYGMIAAVGVAALVARIRSGSLVPPMLLHASYNGVIAVVVLSQGG